MPPLVVVVVVFIVFVVIVVILMSLSKVALDGRVKGDDTSLASSTLLADENNRDIFGLVVSYAVKVRTSVSKRFATKRWHLKATFEMEQVFFSSKILD